MGVMIDGVWRADDGIEADPDGEWRRAVSSYRHWITPDGAAGPTGDAGFAAESDRYHLYVAWNCPWAHRALLARLVKNLEGLISISVAAPKRTDQGWVFDLANGYVDRLFGADAIHQIYTRSGRGDGKAYTGRVTVPVLWDKRMGRIVSNESADIVRMFNTAFAAIAPAGPELYPEDRRDAIDAWNDRIYRTLNNGVYRAGFASSQAAYDVAAAEVFETLDALDAQLAETAYLAGDALSEADLRLFPTLARFDVAYYSAFKCNKRRLIDYPHLWPYAKRLYALPGVADTVHFDIYRRGYHSKSANRNPTGVTPVGPDISWAP
ncbi:MAG: glutathione S-transferase C-terminal domain-containing protein [Alphaproteobacteria bacterium]|nr:glutathione S-transferase C-terminal domain-containing protein [Alphaproteobacteria bacterium]